jgi:predicted LPLAT superfamily acyltransferase
VSATLPPRRPPTGAPEDWSVHRERSNPFAVRLMAWIAVHLGRRISRTLLHPITLYFLAFAPAARRHSARYMGRVLGRPPTWRDRYRHLHAFASTVLDRVYFVCNRLGEFDLKMTENHLVDDTMAQGHGAFLLGAHIGSFEALHAIGVNIPGLRVAMVMYPENARVIHSVLAALAPDFELGIIPIGQRGSTLAIRDWLNSGGLVGLLGDRYLPNEAARNGGSSSLEIPFLGVPTRFTDGPLRLAMLLRRKVIFMVGLYLGGKRYEVRFATLADFSNPPADPAERERQLHAALRDYVAMLESLCREAPYNWFNFHDFWHEDAVA